MLAGNHKTFQEFSNLFSFSEEILRLHCKSAEQGPKMQNNGSFQGRHGALLINVHRKQLNYPRQLHN